MDEGRVTFNCPRINQGAIHCAYPLNIHTNERGYAQKSNIQAQNTYRVSMKNINFSAMFDLSFISIKIELELLDSHIFCNYCHISTVLDSINELK